MSVSTELILLSTATRILKLLTNMVVARSLQEVHTGLSTLMRSSYVPPSTSECMGSSSSRTGSSSSGSGCPMAEELKPECFLNKDGIFGFGKRKSDLDVMRIAVKFLSRVQCQAVVKPLCKSRYIYLRQRIELSKNAEEFECTVLPRMSQGGFDFSAATGLP